MHFLIDAQLPPLLAGWLKANGHEAEHVFDLELDDASDQAIWNRAEAIGAVLITKDEDFVGLRLRLETGPAVCWVRIGNATNPTLIAWFERVFPGILVALESGEFLIEVR